MNQLKWWLRDLWASVLGRTAKDEPKTICMFHCRECGGMHQLKIRVLGSIDDLSELIPTAITMPCPSTGRVVYPAQNDFEFLTEREFDQTYRRK